MNKSIKFFALSFLFVTAAQAITLKTAQNFVWNQDTKNFLTGFSSLAVVNGGGRLAKEVVSPEIQGKFWKLPVLNQVDAKATGILETMAAFVLPRVFNPLGATISTDKNGLRGFAGEGLGMVVAYFAVKAIAEYAKK